MAETLEDFCRSVRALRADHSDLMLLLARTTPRDEVTRRHQVAPISTNLIRADIGERVLGLPGSYG